jgi:hypothetical protein
MFEHIYILQTVLIDSGQTERDALLEELCQHCRLLQTKKGNITEIGSRLIEITEMLEPEIQLLIEADHRVTPTSDPEWCKDEILRPLPPAMGEALLVLFCPKNRARYVMGCLEENFHEDIRTKGNRRAKLLYWAAVLRSIGPLLWVKLRRAGLIALLLEIGRRWCGSA